MVTQNWTRRTFLGSLGSAVPTLKLVLPIADRDSRLLDAASEVDSTKFQPIDLSRFFTARPADFDPREQARKFGGESSLDRLVRMPGGRQSFRGIPFVLAKQGELEKCWLALSLNESSWTTSGCEIVLEREVHFLCIASFCDWDEQEILAGESDVIEKIGQPLADAILSFSDGSRRMLPIRRCFEVYAPELTTRHYGALPHLIDAPRKLTDPLQNGKEWGVLQTGILHTHLQKGPDGYPLPVLWVSALQNPEPTKVVRALLLQAKARDPLIVCGLTVFNGRENPLRLKRLSLYRITLPEPVADSQERWLVEVDLGVVVRRYSPSEFNPEIWLSNARKAVGDVETLEKHTRHIYVEVTASSEATLTLRDVKTNRHYAFDLSQVVPGGEIVARTPGASIEILNHEKVWLHGTVVDLSDDRPTPVRLSFRSKEGRYIPPYGHRTEINDGWFQDYGADVKLLDSSFAYVDGTFRLSFL